MDEDARQEQIHRVLASNAYELRLMQSGDFDSQGRPVPTKEQTMYLADVARRERRAVILGDPGSGKTTLLKYLAFHYARALSQGAEHVLISRVDVFSDGEAGSVEENQPSWRKERGDERPETATVEEDWGPTRLPIYIRIATYANARKENEQLSIQDFLPTYWRGLQLPLPETTIRTIFDDFLNRSNVLLLLDGLDEIADFKERQEIVRQVELLINAHVRDPMVDMVEVKRNPKRAIEMRLPLHSGGNQVILTSRAAGYRAAPLRESIRHYRIQDMSDAAIDAFLQRWCLAVEQRQGESLSAAEQRRRAEAQRSSLLQALQHPRIKRLAVNPLLLTLLALLHRSEGRLPRLRIELYRNATRTLIETWRNTTLTEDEVLDVLGPVADWIHTNEPTGLISQGGMRHLVTQALAAWRGEDPERLPGSFKDEVTNFLETVRRESGLLLERGQGLYSFAHLTFQEYFVARQITRRPADAEQFIQKHLADPRWREPLLLAVAQVAKEARGDLPPLLEAALNAPVPHDDLLHRRLLFVAAALPECAWVPPVLVRRICGELLSHYADSLRQRRFARLRAEITNVYGPLRDSEAARLADEALCKALSGDDQDVMLAAAISLSIHTGTRRLS